jgi:hypothetical protein
VGLPGPCKLQTSKDGGKDTMMKHAAIWFIAFCLMGTVQAHVPIIASDNEGLDHATVIKDPLKSWAVFDHLNASGEVHYYTFYLEQGQKLHVSLFIPYEHNFTPTLAIMGPGIPSQGTPPDYLELPQNAGIMVIQGEQPGQAVFEPFTPSAQYNLVQKDMNVTQSGTYYIAVYHPSTTGAYGLAIGYREEFGLAEWIRVPLDVISIHEWGGQSLGYILAPMLVVVGIGFLFLLQLKNTLAGLFGWTGYTAGLLYIGSSAMIFMQIFIALDQTALTSEVFITLLLGLLPTIAGIIMIKMALEGKIGRKTRITMALLGITGLFIWAGLIIGPVLAIVASVLPSAK